MRLVLRRGRLEAQRAGALITSANDALSGNDQPAYWRFEHRHNVDGALRAVAASAGVHAADTQAALHQNRLSSAHPYAHLKMFHFPEGHLRTIPK